MTRTKASTPSARRHLLQRVWFLPPLLHGVWHSFTVHRVPRTPSLLRAVKRRIGVRQDIFGHGVLPRFNPLSLIHI